MVGTSFLDLFSSIYRPASIGLEDFGDRLSFFTVILLLIASLVISTKTYVLNAISCYISVLPSGEGFKDFLPDYCWIHGTIPLASHEPLPQNDEEWRNYDTYRRINYYQWVPFVLSLQCVLFYLPHICWQVVCNKRAGGDLFDLVKVATESATLERSKRSDQIKRIVEFLEDMIADQQPVRRGRYGRVVKKARSWVGSCLVSKRFGTCLVFCYLAIKVLIIANAFLQMYFIQRFLGFHSGGTAGFTSMQLSKLTNGGGKASDAKSGVPHSAELTALTGYNFGATILYYILSGKEWPETTLFPRVAYCRIPGIRLVGVENAYTAQCALPINMLNEKVYIFLWFWIVLLIIVTLISFFAWLFRLIIAPQRKDFIKRYLRIKGVPNHLRPDQELTRSDLTEFCDNYLRRDGVFMIRMLAMNAGDVVTSEIVELLYCNYVGRLPLPDASAAKSDSLPSQVISNPPEGDDKALLSSDRLPPTYV